MSNDGAGSFTLQVNGELDMSSNKITSVANPTAPQDVVTLDYLEGVVSGSAHVPSIDAHITANTNVVSTTFSYGNGTELLSMNLDPGIWQITYQIGLYSQATANGLHGARFWLENGSNVVNWSSCRAYTYDLAGIANNMHTGMVLIAPLPSAVTITLEGAKLNSTLLQLPGSSAASINIRTSMVAIKLGGS